jgi:hypothetical protein
MRVMWTGEEQDWNDDTPGTCLLPALSVCPHGPLFQLQVKEELLLSSRLLLHPKPADKR